MSVEFKVEKNNINESLNSMNCLFHPLSYSEDILYLKYRETVYKSVPLLNVPKGRIVCSSFMRESLNAKIGDDIHFTKTKNRQTASNININVSLAIPNKSSSHMWNPEEVIIQMKQFFGDYFFSPGQILMFSYENTLLKLVVSEGEGFLTEDTEISFTSVGKGIKMIAKSIFNLEMFKVGYNFADLGIGGLNNELLDMFKIALSTRAIDQNLVDKMEIQHVKGVLLYGPPGTGKTLIARNISRLISTVKPIIVNGPELLNKYVGQSEENIRNLFKPARADYDSLGSTSPVHVIVFDEFDALCKSRGNSTVMVGDNIVNQLLSLLDGVDKLDNILIIAMTNRKDLIDPAILRSGRISLHIPIYLPNELSRKEIFDIHLKTLKTNSLLSDCVDSFELAKLTESCSGADIMSIVNYAKTIELHNKLIEGENTSGILIKQEHLLSSISKLSLGKSQKIIFPKVTDDIQHKIDFSRMKLIDILDSFTSKSNIRNLLVRSHKPKGCKSLLLKSCALNMGVKFTRLITPTDMLNYSDDQKANHLIEIFREAYLCENSLILIDDINIIMNDNSLYDNSISPKLWNLMKILFNEYTLNERNGHHKVTVICTASESKITDEKYLNIFNNIGYI